MVLLLLLVAFISHLLIIGYSGPLNAFLRVLKVNNELFIDLSGRFEIPVNALRLSAYCSFIAILSISEAVLRSWRNDMSNKLYDINDELVQHDLAQPTSLIDDGTKANLQALKDLFRREK